jgi:hypothetical protein
MEALYAYHFSPIKLTLNIQFHEHSEGQLFLAA